VPRFRPIRLLSRGFGGPAAAIMLRAFLNFDDVVEEIRQNVLGRSRNRDEVSFYDDVDVYKISAMLVSINKKPLDNVLYNKMSKLIFEKKINLSINLINQTGKKSDPYRIVIAEYKTTRGYDE
jgi:hypothetical protein